MRSLAHSRESLNIEIKMWRWVQNWVGAAKLLCMRTALKHYSECSVVLLSIIYTTVQYTMPTANCTGTVSTVSVASARDVDIERSSVKVANHSVNQSISNVWILLITDRWHFTLPHVSTNRDNEKKLKQTMLLSRWRQSGVSGGSTVGLLLPLLLL